jgi:hypothetical protein
MPAEEVFGPSPGPQPARQQEMAAPSGPQLPPEARGGEDAYLHTHRNELYAATESHPQPVPPGAHAGAYRAAPGPDAAKGEHFVVQHGSLGGRWSQGEVFHKKALHPDADIERLLRIGAVRPADEREAAMGQATPQGADTPQGQSYEVMTADLRRENQQLQQQVAQLKDDLRQAKQAPPAGAAPAVQGVDPRLVAEKDRAIEDLTRRVRAAEGERDELRGQLAAAQEEAAAAGRRRKG